MDGGDHARVGKLNNGHLRRGAACLPRTLSAGKTPFPPSLPTKETCPSSWNAPQNLPSFDARSWVG